MGKLNGWLDGKIIDVGHEGIYRISAIDSIEPGSAVALKIPRKGTYFYVEFRENILEELRTAYDKTTEDLKAELIRNYDKSLLIYLGPYFDNGGDSQLVDTRNKEKVNLKDVPLAATGRILPEMVDAPLRLGETFTDPETGITIQYVSLDKGIATVKVTNLPAKFGS